MQSIDLETNKISLKLSKLSTYLLAKTASPQKRTDPSTNINRPASANTNDCPNYLAVDQLRQLKKSPYGPPPRLRRTIILAVL